MIPNWLKLHKKWHKTILPNGDPYNVIDDDELGRFRSMVRVCEFLCKRGCIGNGKKWVKKETVAPDGLVNLEVR